MRRLHCPSAGLHPTLEAGIAYDSKEQLAMSIAVSGGYEADRDAGDLDCFDYQGQGGRDRLGGGLQTKSQAWVRGNLALRHNYKKKVPLRVLRKTAPDCHRYDGLYLVVECWEQEHRGADGAAAVDRDGAQIKVCMFKLRRMCAAPSPLDSSSRHLASPSPRPHLALASPSPRSRLALASPSPRSRLDLARRRAPRRDRAATSPATGRTSRRCPTRSTRSASAIR